MGLLKLSVRLTVVLIILTGIILSFRKPLLEILISQSLIKAGFTKTSVEISSLRPGYFKISKLYLASPGWNGVAAVSFENIILKFSLKSLSLVFIFGVVMCIKGFTENQK